MLHVTETIAIQEWELSEQFTRSQGPGGQNVNKVETAVELRFEAATSPSLPDPVKRRLQRLAGRRWTQDGAVLILSQETRSQARNRELARERLADLIRQALVAPKRRIATRPTLGSQRRRLKAKSVRGEVKSLRGKVEDE
ncbi:MULTISPECIES: alternative ribosome rescue aminoacyl-tRNA hydrolase ArfB [Paracoccus]|jgi:ribosome-associated protein|uniref:Aminoacyl-tRNA hydrolase n=1 Tax=Paracoccus haeundaensis TaxID=225362 RepID=A0A5C4R5Y5_9RHOB|nr:MULTISPECIES: alternative ribosome rescue aminoacyl-tRNA hydrolase ArfB [Paracoccus]KIX17349.1 peptide chain release factor I [Paracoccus sp. 228]MBF5078940.1 aminoacyl-tRNA hydrolase [Paracoccus sp. NBH48]MCO6361870.1 aminoacyl-tRNA hydrolase [Paracoccus sp. 08]QXI62515.1 Peptidyl-tRNA hydrolase ArfB [Paracoccus marcusii]TNH39339.1 aminoacyl-tRNA hydrolase [Paracoccus haeundaensis]|tara:strand:- start:732 stop:1151 length:420 start_codon:yes stop_codon:yes gene_type:complete